MTQPFNPQEHLIKLPRRLKNKTTGAWETTYDDYLEVRWRVVMFREPPTPTNGKAPPTQPTSEPTGRPTEADITALTTLAIVECHDEPEVFAQRLRTIMGLKPTAGVAPKLLTRTMSMAHYLEVLGYYQRLQQQLARSNISQERLAARVSAEASEDLQDILDHAPHGLLMDVSHRIEARLQARLNGQQTTAVA